MKVCKLKSIFCHVPQSSLVFADFLFQHITFAGPNSHGLKSSHKLPPSLLRWSIPCKHVSLGVYIGVQGRHGSLPSTNHSNLPFKQKITSIYTHLNDHQLLLIQPNPVQSYTTPSAQCRSPTLLQVLQRAKASCRCLLESHLASHQANPLSSCPRNQSIVNFRQSPSASAANVLKVPPSPRVKDSNGRFCAKRSSASSLAPSTQSCLASGATMS
jgi:hypothetical protein